MHIERIGSESKLVCWMGAKCGVAELPQHCGVAMRESAA